MNPILPSRYLIADVEARHFGDERIYLYGSSDIRENTTYCSHDYRVFSSLDLLDWQDHGISFRSSDSHAGPEALLYAPDCIEYRGRYYLGYCTFGDREGFAVSDSPVGPFTQARPLEGADRDAIDPALFVDEDGLTYCFWGQFQLRGARWKVEDGSIEASTLKTHLLEEEKDGFHEGACIRKRNGWYYLIYTDISRGRPTCLGYAMSRSVLGPYEKKGIVIDNNGCDPDTWNNHGSIEEFNGQWYVFYHRACQGGRYTRRVCIEPFSFREDGTIEEVQMTTQGVSPPIPATSLMEGWRACLLSGSLHTAVSDPADPESGEHLTRIENGSWAAFKFLDFDSVPISTFIATAASATARGGVIEVHLESPEGPLLAECAIQHTGTWRDWNHFRAPLLQVPSGMHAVFLVFKGGLGRLFDLQSFHFQ